MVIAEKLPQADRRRHLRPGFTLMELVIVIAILGVLAFVVVPNVLTYLSQAKEETTKTNMGTINQEVQNYLRKVGRPPQSLTDLIEKPGDLTQRQWGGPYLVDSMQNALKEVPKDGWGNDYQYQVNPNGHPPYKIYSLGSKGEAGSEEDWIYPS